MRIAFLLKNLGYIAGHVQNHGNCFSCYNKRVPW